MTHAPNRREMLRLMGGGVAAMAAMPSLLKANCGAGAFLLAGDCFNSPIYQMG